MRIVYLNAQHLPTTEVDSQQVVKTASALAAEGADVELTVPRPLAWTRRTTREFEEAITQYYSVHHPFALRLVPTTMRAPGQVERGVAAVVASFGLRRRPFDVLYVRNYLCALAAYSMGLEFVLESHRFLEKHYPRRARAVRHMGRTRRITGVVTNGDLVAASFQALGFPRERVLTAHNGYDPEDLEPARTREQARRTLGLPLRDPIVFYGGHLQPHKGVDIFVPLARETPEVTYVLAGGTPHDLDWFRGLMPLELHNIRLLGWRPPHQLVDYLYAADVLIIPPSAAPLRDHGRTTYPMKVYAYLGVGRPIVAPNTPDLADVLRDGATGLLVEPDNPRQAGAAIRRILCDPAFAGRLGEAALAEAQCYTWRRRARRILDFLDSLRSGTPGAECQRA
jgi:glycosyltransferase involved in cell wall biosynthesis